MIGPSCHVSSVTKRGRPSRMIVQRTLTVKLILCIVRSRPNFSIVRDETSDVETETHEDENESVVFQSLPFLCIDFKSEFLGE